jgi:hypothetical protein
MDENIIAALNRVSNVLSAINYFLRKAKMRHLISQETLNEVAKIKKAQQVLTRQLVKKSDSLVVPKPIVRKTGSIKKG